MDDEVKDFIDGFAETHPEILEYRDKSWYYRYV